VIKLMDELGGPATIAMAGPRFFGCDRSCAAADGVAADWLATAWDQNTILAEATPGSVALEATARAGQQVRTTGPLASRHTNLIDCPAEGCGPSSVAAQSGVVRGAE
jgi:hypothetical protein